MSKVFNFTHEKTGSEIIIHENGKASAIKVLKQIVVEPKEWQLEVENTLILENIDDVDDEDFEFDDFDAQFNHC